MKYSNAEEEQISIARDKDLSIYKAIELIPLLTLEMSQGYHLKRGTSATWEKRLLSLNIR